VSEHILQHTRGNGSYEKQSMKTQEQYRNHNVSPHSLANASSHKYPTSHNGTRRTTDVQTTSGGFNTHVGVRSREATTRNEGAAAFSDEKDPQINIASYIENQRLNNDVPHFPFIEAYSNEYHS